MFLLLGAMTWIHEPIKPSSERKVKANYPGVQMYRDRGNTHALSVYKLVIIQTMKQITEPQLY